MRGFTLIELLVVSAIIGIVAALTLGLWRESVSRAGVEEAAERVRGLLEDARGRTLARANGSAYGVRLESDRATLFSAPFVPMSSSNTVYTLPPGVVIASVSLSGGGSDALFDLFTGETRSDGSLIIERAGNSSLRKTIRVFTSGYAEVR